MSDYIIRRSTGESMLIPEGTLDRNYSVALTGDEYRNYGHNFAQNFINLTGNFAGSVPPDKNLNIHYDSVTKLPPPSPSALLGQLWFDTNAKLLKIYDGDSWDAVTSVIAEVTSDLMPSEGSDIDIGADDNRWHSMYTAHLDVSTNKNGIPDADGKAAIAMDGVMTIRNTNSTLSTNNRVGKIVPYVSGSKVSLADIGDSSAPFREVHTKSLVFDGKGGLKLYGAGNAIEGYYIVPSTTSSSSTTMHIGHKGNFFRSVSASVINADLLSAINNVINIDKTIIPSDNAYVNIGSSTNRLSELFSDGITTKILSGGDNCAYTLTAIPEISSITAGEINGGNATTTSGWKSFNEFNSGKFKANFSRYFGEFTLCGADRTDPNFSYNLIAHNLTTNAHNGGTYNINSNCFWDSTGEFGNQGKLLYATNGQPATTLTMYSGPYKKSTPSIKLGVSHPRGAALANTPVIMGGEMHLGHDGWHSRLYDVDGTTIKNAITMTGSETTFNKKIVAPELDISGGIISSDSVKGKLLGTNGNATSLYIDSVSTGEKFVIEGEEFSPTVDVTTNLGSTTNRFDSAYIKTVNSDSIHVSSNATLPDTTVIGSTPLLTGGVITDSLMPTPSQATNSLLGSVYLADVATAISGGAGAYAITAELLGQLFSFSDSDIPVSSGGYTAPSGSTARFGSIAFGNMRINFGWVKFSSTYDADVTIDLTQNGMGGYIDNKSYVCVCNPIRNGDASLATFNQDASSGSTIALRVQKEGSSGYPQGASFVSIGKIS